MESSLSEYEDLFESTVSGMYICALALQLYAVLALGTHPSFPESTLANGNGLLDSPVESFPGPGTPTKALQDLRIAQYFQHFLKTLSPWYDLSDQHCTFATEIAREALHEPVLFGAVIALSALHISKTTAPPARTAADFYHAYCVPTLVGLRADIVYMGSRTILATICLLRSYAVLDGDCIPAAPIWLFF